MDRMVADGVAPNYVSYILLTQCYVRERRRDKLRAILGKLRTQAELRGIPVPQRLVDVLERLEECGTSSTSSSSSREMCITSYKSLQSPSSIDTSFTEWSSE